ncbi:MAG: hypothetical protein JRI23_16410 [Deltaproteobacteria bacterium]|jgi:hypothetical protein|nr:hypothetical protein [Deltaproteobacteria bacterium]MBW2533358.1 hypothetical protein [Deltaproteobacteria bacterium]
MCWSGEASAAIALGGLTSAYFLKRKGEPKEIYLPTAYFVLMEGLQAITYTVVDECGSPVNTLLTRLAIVHISFQPFFINMLGMEFVDEQVKRRIQKPIYLLCGVVAALCLARLLPFYETLGRCQLGTPLCSHLQTCAYRGEWHIGWDILLNGLNPRWWWYLVAAFAVPVLYGSWKWSLYHFLVGPLLAALTTTDVNERPAVWCLFSTCIIALLVNTRVRSYIYVKSWPTWRPILRWRCDPAKRGSPGL